MRRLLHSLLIALCLMAGLTMADPLVGEAAPVVTVQTPLVRIMPIGDSITDGLLFREAGFEATHGYDVNAGGYRPTLWNSLKAAGHHIQMIGPYESGATLPADQRHHAGRSSDELRQIGNTVHQYFQPTTPDIVLLIAGTNNMYPDNYYFSGWSSSQAPGDLTYLLATIQQQAPNAWTIVQPIPEMTWSALGDTGWGQRSRVYNQQVPVVVQARQAAGQRVVLASPGRVDVTGDGAHPSALGYQQISAAWVTALTSVLPRPSPCGDPQRLSVKATPVTASSISVALVARGDGNQIQRVKWGVGTNVEPVTDLGIHGSEAVFTVRRAGPGAATLAFTVTDGCGDWSTFVGGGPRSF